MNYYKTLFYRFTYTGNFVFYGLIPSTEYEVIIQSRNKEGWSEASDIFRFSTRDRGIKWFLFDTKLNFEWGLLKWYNARLEIDRVRALYNTTNENVV